MSLPSAETVQYPYRDERGRLLYSVVRHTPKRFEILGSTGRTIQQFPEATVLYRLPELLATEKGELVYVCAGEKDVDRLRSFELTATTNPGGCRLGWKESYTACFQGRTVVILADNDRPGVRLAEQVHSAFEKATIASVILQLPRLRRAEDVSDWLDFRRGTINELHQCVARQFAGNRPAAPPRSAGGHRNRHTIFTSRLSTAERMILLAVQHFTGTAGRVTVGDLANAAGVHRVTAQGILSELRNRGILDRAAGKWSIRFERVV